MRFAIYMVLCGDGTLLGQIDRHADTIYGCPGEFIKYDLQCPGILAPVWTMTIGAELTEAVKYLIEDVDEKIRSGSIRCIYAMIWSQDTYEEEIVV